MNFAFFQWVHDELAALRAAVARLEGHTGSPESKPAPKPEEVTQAFSQPAAQNGQTASLSAYMASGGHVAETSAPAPDHTGFDFGNVPSGNPKRNTLEGGKGYTYTFTVPNPTKLRIVVADDNTMGKPAFDNFTLTIKQNGEVVQNVSQPSNTSASYIETPELHGSYSMDFSVDKTAPVSLQCGQG